MKKRYYKIIRGYGAEDYIEITAEELEKAYYAFLLKKDAIYSGGAVKGADIVAIQPDYHRTMGWNRGYKMDSMDFAQVREKGVENSMRLELSGTEDKIKYLIKTKQEHLIGKNIVIPELSGNTGELVTLSSGNIGECIKQLANKLSINNEKDNTKTDGFCQTVPREQKQNL